MAKTSHIVEYGPTMWECTIIVDDSVETLQRMKDMVLHWQGGKMRIQANGGDIKKTFLQQLAREICLILATHDYTAAGVIEKFENRDGWYKMDGSMGILIESIDDFDLEPYEFIVLPGTPIS